MGARATAAEIATAHYPFTNTCVRHADHGGQGTPSAPQVVAEAVAGGWFAIPVAQLGRVHKLERYSPAPLVAYNGAGNSQEDLQVNGDSVSRRGFMTRAAAACAAGSTLAASMRGVFAQASQDEAKTATLRWGIIGTGTRGTFTHIPVIKEAPQSQLVALCDVHEGRLRTAASKVDHPVQTYSDYQQLLSDRDVNAVVIASPNLFHREQLLAALQAGKHVLCEKPAGVTPADAAAIESAAVTAGDKVVMFGMQYLNNARQRKLRELVDSGRIGKPKYLVQNVSRGDWNRSDNVWQYPDPKVNGGKPGNWRFSHAATGGTLNEFSCHYLDLLHWMVGAVPESVSCDGEIAVYKDGRNTWDCATLMMKYPSGVAAVHTLSLFGPSRNELTVMGDEGSISTNDEAIRVSNPGGRGRNRGGAKSQEIKPEETTPPGGKRSADRATLMLFEDFLQCVTAGKKPEASAARALAASRTCWLAELASERRAEVKWGELS